MKRILPVITAGILFFSSVLNAQTCALCGDAPLTCPPRNWIITLGIDPLLLQDLGGNYYGGFQGQYAGTNNLWTFRIGPIVAKSVSEAYIRLNQLLPLITITSGPFHITSNAWVCYYSNLSGVQMTATTPPIGCFNASAP